MYAGFQDTRHYFFQFHHDVCAVHRQIKSDNDLSSAFQRTHMRSPAWMNGEVGRVISDWPQSLPNDGSSELTSPLVIVKAAWICTCFSKASVTIRHRMSSCRAEEGSCLHGADFCKLGCRKLVCQTSDRAEETETKGTHLESSSLLVIIFSTSASA